MAATATKKKKTSTKTRKSVINEKFARLARIFGCSVNELKTLSKRTENALRSVGKAVNGKNGRVTVYAKKQVPMVFTHAKHVMRAKALVKDAIDCPLAKCGKDPDACWLGAHSSSVHVGNVMVTFWSELCPHIELKCTLSPALRAAVRNWDEQVKKKVKNRRFNLEDGVYYLSPCPPSFVKRGHGTKVHKTTRGKNFNRPTRKLTVRSDISLAISAINAKNAKKAFGKKG